MIKRTANSLFARVKLRRSVELKLEDIVKVKERINKGLRYLEDSKSIARVNKGRSHKLSSFKLPPIEPKVTVRVPTLPNSE